MVNLEPAAFVRVFCKGVLAFLFLKQNGEPGPAYSLRQPLGALDGGLKGESPGGFWVLGSYASKASSYH